MSLFPDISLSVVVPVFNEAARIERMVGRATASLDRIVGDYEILLIDDASTDGTGRVIDELAAGSARIVAVHNPRNLKQGGSLRVGFRRATHQVVTHNAVDYPFDFDDLPIVLERIATADVVVVTRRSYPGVSTMRRLLSWVNRTLIRVLFGLRITDYNFVQVFRREALLEDESFSDATAFMTVERIVRAHRAGLRVDAVEAPYHRREEGMSTSGRPSVIVRSLADMFLLWAELRLGWTPKRRRRATVPTGDTE